MNKSLLHIASALPADYQDKALSEDSLYAAVGAISLKLQEMEKANNDLQKKLFTALTDNMHLKAINDMMRQPLNIAVNNVGVWEYNPKDRKDVQNFLLLAYTAINEPCPPAIMPDSPTDKQLRSLCLYSHQTFNILPKDVQEFIRRDILFWWEAIAKELNRTNPSNEFGLHEKNRKEPLY